MTTDHYHDLMDALRYPEQHAAAMELERELVTCVAHGMTHGDVQRLRAFALDYPATVPWRVTPAEVVRTVRRKYYREGVEIVGELAQIYREERLRESYPWLFRSLATPSAG